MWSFYIWLFIIWILCGFISNLRGYVLSLSDCVALDVCMFGLVSSKDMVNKDLAVQFLLPWLHTTLVQLLIDFGETDVKGMVWFIYIVQVFCSSCVARNV